MFAKTGNQSKADSLRWDFPKPLKEQLWVQETDFFNKNKLFSHLDLQDHNNHRIKLHHDKYLEQDART